MQNTYLQNFPPPYTQEIRYHLEVLKKPVFQPNFYQNNKKEVQKINIILIKEFPPQKLSPIPSIKRITLKSHPVLPLMNFFQILWLNLTLGEFSFHPKSLYGSKNP